MAAMATPAPSFPLHPLEERDGFGVALLTSDGESRLPILVREGHIRTGGQEILDNIWMTHFHCVHERRAFEEPKASIYGGALLH